MSAPTPQHPPAPEPQALLQAAQHLSAELARRSAQRDAERQLPYDAVQVFREQRLGLLRVPTEHGGAGGSIRDVAELTLLLARGDSNVAQALLAHFVVLERIRLTGSPAQQRHYQRLAADGTLFGAAAAERGGRFRGDMQTRLARRGAAFVLHGTKHYSTGALFADVLKIRALDEQGRMVAALVPATRAGVSRVDDWDGMGQRCTASGTTVLEHVGVQAHEILSLHAWSARRQHTGALAQIVHCAIDTGIAFAALDDAIAWARHGIRPVRESGLERAQDDPYILHTLGTMSSAAEAARALVRHAADLIDRAAHARFDGAGDSVQADELAVQASIATAEAKIISTQAALRNTQLLFDVGGAATTLRTHNHDRHWRNARTHTTHDPLAYKYRAVGNHLLNQVDPPLTFSY